MDSRGISDTHPIDPMPIPKGGHGPSSEAEAAGLIQVGCTINGSQIFIDSKGAIIVDGKINSISEDTERDGLDSSNNGGGYFSSLRTFFHSKLFPLVRYFYRDAKTSEIKKMEEGKKDENEGPA